MFTTKIIEEVDKTHFSGIVERHKEHIVVSPHACDHLSDAQRKIFNEETLKGVILNQQPVGIGLQRNGRCASFYKRKGGFLKIILAIKETQLEIITFINTKTMPNLKRLSHDE